MVLSQKYTMTLVVSGKMHLCFKAFPPNIVSSKVYLIWLCYLSSHIVLFLLLCPLGGSVCIGCGVTA